MKFSPVYTALNAFPGAACGLVLFALAGQAEEPAVAGAAGAIAKSAVPVAVDGVLDEECWQKAEALDAVYILGKVGVKAANCPMRVRYTWDDHYLYVGYETFDKNLIALGQGEKQGPSDNLRESAHIWHPDPKVKVDVIEFFITFGDQHFFWELHHNALNQFNDVLIVRGLPFWQNEGNRAVYARWGIYFGSRDYVEDEAEFKLAMAVRLKPRADGQPSTPNDEKDEDTGYSGELRLPWHGIGAPLSCQTLRQVPPEKEGEQPKQKPGGPWKLAGKEVWILAVCQDGDLENRYHHSSPTLKPGWFHEGVGEYPRYRLTE
ncbi:MAG: hypothetical protein HYU36_10225 [Planctomycetes bacterium]|nr:hypothetical protein [Planctomycetota bacterium]